LAIDNVKLEDGNIVLRLFPSEGAAQAFANSQAAYGRRFEVVAHPSQIGWLIRDQASGDLYDAHGIIRGYALPKG
jgi:hypothetical protein